MKPARAAAVLFAVLAASACQPEVEPRVEAPRPVRTVIAEPVSVEATITLPGEIRPRIETRYGFRVGGKIAQRLVSVGDRVVAGTVLARLDPQDVAPAIAAQLAQREAARTDMRLARSELERLRELREKNFISAAQLDRQQAASDAAQARLDAAQAQLSAARNSATFQVLRADSEGVVTAIEAEAGQVVAAGQPVIRVANTAEKEVLVNVPERDVHAARGAGRWTISIPALGERALEATLRELSPLSDPASRTYPARLALAGDSSGVELGMTAIARASRDTEPAFVLPLSALWSKNDVAQVWLVDPQTLAVRPVPVVTAGLLDDSVRIVRGISRGDRVVTAGASLLVEGQKVRLLESPQ